MNWDHSKYPVELPVDGSQDSEFLKMGITFGPFGLEDEWRGAHLPKGWRVETNVELLRSFVLDQRGWPRAIIHLNSKRFEQVRSRTSTIHMRPLRRFHYGRHDPKSPDVEIRFCLWDAAVAYPGKRKILMDETHVLPSRKQHSSTHINRGDIYYGIFEKKVKEWLNAGYPRWEGYDGHWDEDYERKEENN